MKWMINLSDFLHRCWPLFLVLVVLLALICVACTKLCNEQFESDVLKKLKEADVEDYNNKCRKENELHNTIAEQKNKLDMKNKIIAKYRSTFGKDPEFEYEYFSQHKDFKDL